MADQLEILDVRLGTPRPSTVTAALDRVVDVSIDLRNNSKSTLHLIASVRSLDYDPSTKTLLIGLSDPEPQGGMTPLHFVAPHTTTIGPRETATIQVSVPLIVRKMVPSNKLGLGVEELDVSGVQNVRIQVAASPTPFYPKPADSAEQVFRELRSWGKRTEKTLPRTIESSGPAPAPRREPPRKKK